MLLTWTRGHIPHGFLCETPIHLIYRVADCGCVGELRELTDELKQQCKLLRHLPHTTPVLIQDLVAQYMESYDALLDAQDQSKYVLTRPELRSVVLESWMTLRERQECRLYAVCVMGNHVHVLLAGQPDRTDSQIGLLLRRHKTYTDMQIRAAAPIDGKVWDPSFFDRYMRPGRFNQILHYILMNPVTAGLVTDWRDWPGTWVDERCLAHV